MAGTVNGRSNSDEKFAALDERVTNLRSSLQHLEQSTSSGFARIEAKLGEQGAAFSAAQKTPWGIVASFVGVAFSILVGIGWLVYTPVQTAQIKLETGLVRLTDVVTSAIKEGPDTYVPRREIDTSRIRAAEDRVNTLAAITDLRAISLPRNEWLLRNAAVDSEFIDLRRTVEQLRGDLGGTYNLRDAFSDIKDRLERAEQRLILLARPPP